MWRTIVDLFARAKVGKAIVGAIRDLHVEDVVAARERIARGVRAGDFDDVIRMALEADARQAKRAAKRETRQ